MNKPDKIQYLPPEEIEKYISQKEDISNSDMFYFTCIPSTKQKFPANEGCLKAYIPI